MYIYSAQAIAYQTHVLGLWTVLLISNASYSRQNYYVASSCLIFFRKQIQQNALIWHPFYRDFTVEGDKSGG